MRQPILAGNWKMYKTPAQTTAFFDEFRPLIAETEGRSVVICPPFVDLFAAIEGARGSSIEVGAQNMHWAEEGAFTGEISAGMLGSVGCRWVIVGHSERRQYFGETDLDVCRKAGAALDAGLTPIVCVGETLEQRESHHTADVLCKQFEGGLSSVAPDRFGAVVIAYEPIWAIGTGKTATPEMAAEAHGVLREQIRKHLGAPAAESCRILYGGSVKPDNIEALMAHPDIDGALVGGASLKPKDFAAIVNY